MRARGSSVAELLIAVSVFSMLLVVIAAITQFGSRGVRTIESKTDAQSDMLHVTTDFATELSRGSLSALGVYTPPTDFHWAVWTKSDMNDPADVDTAGNPITVGNPMQMVVDLNGNFHAQRYVLYYITRLDAAEHINRYGYLCSSYGGSNGPDTTCPHKWLIRKDLTVVTSTNTGEVDTIGAQSDPKAITRLQALIADASVTEQSLAAEMTPNGPTCRVKVLAKNVLSFEPARLKAAPLATDPPVASASGPLLLADFKFFRAADAAQTVTIGAVPIVTGISPTPDGSGNYLVPVQTKLTAPVDSTGHQQIHTTSVVEDPYGPFTIELDARLLPENP